MLLPFLSQAGTTAANAADTASDPAAEAEAQQANRLAEMTRLACACGARRETLAGLAGMGDLVLTCTGDLSRNRTVGYELGKGRKLAEIIGSMRMVAEGVKTTAATVMLAAQHGIEMPITQQVHRILEGQITPREAIRQLMERALKDE